MTAHPQGGIVVQVWHQPAATPPGHSSSAASAQVQPWRADGGPYAYTPSNKSKYLGARARDVVSVCTVVGLLVGFGFGAFAPYVNVETAHASIVASAFALAIVLGVGLFVKMRPGNLLWGVIHAALAAAVAPFML